MEQAVDAAILCAVAATLMIVVVALGNLLALALWLAYGRPL